MSEVKTTLSLDALLAVDDAEYVDVPTPEWGGEGHVTRFGSINADTMLNFFESTANETNREKALRLVVMSLVDEQNTRVAPDQIDTFIAAFRKRRIRVMNRIIDAVRELNGLNGVTLKNDSSVATTDATLTSSPESEASST